MRPPLAARRRSPLRQRQGCAPTSARDPRAERPPPPPPPPRRRPPHLRARPLADRARGPRQSRQRRRRRSPPQRWRRALRWRPAPRRRVGRARLSQSQRRSSGASREVSRRGCRAPPGAARALPAAAAATSSGCCTPGPTRPRGPPPLGTIYRRRGRGARWRPSHGCSSWGSRRRYTPEALLAASRRVRSSTQRACARTKASVASGPLRHREAVAATTCGLRRSSTQPPASLAFHGRLQLRGSFLARLR